MKVLLIGYGRMGRLVESLAGEYDAEIAGRIGRAESERPGPWPAADVAIDFSTADAVPGNVARLAARGIDVVIGTTGWRAREAELRRIAQDAAIGVVAAPNFAIGVNLFAALVERAGELLKDHPAFGAWIHELHHAAKRDAPSGTALQLEAAFRRGGLDQDRSIDLDARGIDSRHAHRRFRQRRRDDHADAYGARFTSGFARGALEAARWVHGRTGWFGMADVLGGRS